MATLSVRPDYREFISENIGLILLLVLCVLSLPFASYQGIRLLSICSSIGTLILAIILSWRYVSITAVVWIVNDDTICRIKGVFVRHTDYIELYRVVDYSEFQSLPQKLLSVKTITIISTDKTDCVMDIYGVPAPMPLVSTIRNRVEKCKQEKRIYEITNN